MKDTHACLCVCVCMYVSDFFFKRLHFFKSDSTRSGKAVDIVKRKKQHPRSQEDAKKGYQVPVLLLYRSTLHCWDKVKFLASMAVPEELNKDVSDLIVYPPKVKIW